MMKILFFTAILMQLGCTTASGQCLENIVELPGKTNTSGNGKIDILVSNLCRQCATHFGVNVDVWFFDDQASPNAYAQKGCQSQGCDGSVWFGKTLLKYELDSLGKDAVAGVVAHEMAHIFQQKYHSALTGKHKELQADFLAGYFLGAKDYFPDLKIQEFAISLIGKGDYDYHSPEHHGTPSQRFDALMTGYLESESTLPTAYVISERVVPNIKPSKQDRQLHGASEIKLLPPETILCDYCNGTGKRLQTCNFCQGSGQKEGQTCASCNGSGKSKNIGTCTHCNGKGRL